MKFDFFARDFKNFKTTLCICSPSRTVTLHYWKCISSCTIDVVFVQCNVCSFAFQKQIMAKKLEAKFGLVLKKAFPTLFEEQSE